MEDSLEKRTLRNLLGHHNRLLGLNLAIPPESRCCMGGRHPRKDQNIISPELFFLMEPVEESNGPDDYSVVYGEGTCTPEFFRQQNTWLVRY